MDKNRSCLHPVEDGCAYCCELCDYDNHVCRGCGDPLYHPDTVCQECATYEAMEVVR